jgi:hypothetical protein
MSSFLCGKSVCNMELIPQINWAIFRKEFDKNNGEI